MMRRLERVPTRESADSRSRRRNTECVATGPSVLSGVGLGTLGGSDARRSRSRSMGRGRGRGREVDGDQSGDLGAMPVRIPSYRTICSVGRTGVLTHPGNFLLNWI